MGTPRIPSPVPGWSCHERAVAWFKAFLLALRSGDARMLDVARAELRALGIDVAPLPRMVSL